MESKVMRKRTRTQIDSGVVGPNLACLTCLAQNAGFRLQGRLCRAGCQDCYPDQVGTARPSVERLFAVDDNEAFFPLIAAAVTGCCCAAADVASHLHEAAASFVGALVAMLWEACSASFQLHFNH